MLAVTTPATDANLLTTAELRAAAGVADSSKDSELEVLGLQVSASIAIACNVRRGGASVPTLRSEVVTETLRLPSCRSVIYLSRRPVTAIGSVTAAGSALGGSDYEFDAASGALYRLQSDQRIAWEAVKVSVVYTAGFATVPPDLKLAASKLVTDLWSSRARDPNLKRVQIEGVSEREYWVAPTTDPLLSSEIQQLIAPYRNHWV